MTGVIATIPRYQFSSSTGVPLALGTLTVYLAGTTTPTDTWQDSALSTLNTNPVQLDSSGSCVLWLDSTKSYKFVLKNAAGAIQWTEDNIKTVADVANTLRTDLAASSGSSLSGFIQSGTGAVPRTVQQELRLSVNVEQFGAVSDGNFSSGVASGTDSLFAFNLAISAAITLGLSKVYAPGGNYYLSGKLTLPRGITLFGDGMAHMPVWTSGANRRGTVLLINGATGDDCIAYDTATSSGQSGLKEITVAHVGSTTNRCVVNITDHLYPSMNNVELFSLVKSEGIGLYLIGGTLWGSFNNVLAICQNAGTASEHSFRYGLASYGLSPTQAANANVFTGGQFVGTWAGAIFDGEPGDTGALSIVFQGTKFDLNWNGTYTPTYLANAVGLFDYPIGPVYITPIVRINKGRDTAFHGCYFEAAGEPATYNDGVNGVYDLVPVFWNEGPTVNSGTGVIDSNFNNCYLYDTAIESKVDPTGGGYNHSSRLTPVAVIRQATPQAIPSYVWTKIAFDTSLFGDTSHLLYDAATDVVKIRTKGTYLITSTLFYDGWATANTYAQIRIQTDAGYTFYGELKREQGAGIGIVIQQTQIINLNAGESVWVESFHVQGADQNTSANGSSLSIVQI